MSGYLEYPGCDGLPGAINGAQITPRRVVNIFIAGRLFMIMGRNIFFEAMHVRIFEPTIGIDKRKHRNSENAKSLFTFSLNARHFKM